MTLPAQILTAADLPAYETACGRYYQAMSETLPNGQPLMQPYVHRRLGFDLAPRHEEAAWVYLGEVLDMPQVASVTVSMHPHSEGFRDVVVQVHLDDGTEAFPADTFYLNHPWPIIATLGLAVRTHDLASAMSGFMEDGAITYTRDDWEDAAIAYLGPDWASARRAQLAASSPP